jgi:hypothetical protein
MRDGEKQQCVVEAVNRFDAAARPLQSFVRCAEEHREDPS